MIDIACSNDGILRVIKDEKDMEIINEIHLEGGNCTIIYESGVQISKKISKTMYSIAERCQSAQVIQMQEWEINKEYRCGLRRYV